MLTDATLLSAVPTQHIAEEVCHVTGTALIVYWL